LLFSFLICFPVNSFSLGIFFALARSSTFAVYRAPPRAARVFSPAGFCPRLVRALARRLAPFACILISVPPFALPCWQICRASLLSPRISAPASLFCGSSILVASLTSSPSESRGPSLFSLRAIRRPSDAFSSSAHAMLVRFFFSASPPWPRRLPAFPSSFSCISWELACGSFCGRCFFCFGRWLRGSAPLARGPCHSFGSVCLPLHLSLGLSLSPPPPFFSPHLTLWHSPALTLLCRFAPSILLAFWLFSFAGRGPLLWPALHWPTSFSPSLLDCFLAWLLPYDLRARPANPPVLAVAPFPSMCLAFPSLFPSGSPSPLPRSSVFCCVSPRFPVFGVTTQALAPPLLRQPLRWAFPLKGRVPVSSGFSFCHALANPTTRPPLFSGPLSPAALPGPLRLP